VRRGIADRRARAGVGAARGRRSGRRSAAPAECGPVESFHVAPAEQVARGRPDGREPAGPDRLAQPAGVAADDGRGLGHAQRVAGLVEVAVVAEVAVIDRPSIDGVAGRPGRAELAELAACSASVVRPAAGGSPERLVRPGDRLEPALGLRIRPAAVRVERPRKAPEGVLDLRLGRGPRDTQRAVVIGPRRRPSSPAQVWPRPAASASATRDVSPIARFGCAPSGVNGSRSWLQRSIAIRA
jgi:hypothetical protein